MHSITVDVCSFVRTIIICTWSWSEPEKDNSLQLRHQILIESMKVLWNFISFVSFHWLSKSQVTPWKMLLRVTAFMLRITQTQSSLTHTGPLPIILTKKWQWFRVPVPIILVGISIQNRWIWTMGGCIGAHNWCYGAVSNGLNLWVLIIAA